MLLDRVGIHLPIPPTRHPQDEVVVVVFVASFEQRTIPWQVFSGIREHISPTILAVATILTSVSILLLTAVEILRRRGERLRGIQAT